MKEIPQIYEENKTALDGYALGSLPDSIDCKVTEERNGEFFCSMTYPAQGMNADLFKVGRILAVKPNIYDPVQAFRIATIEKKLSGEMTITAYHISYDLSNVVVMPFTANTLADALTGLVTYGFPTNTFTFDTDKTVTATFQVTQPTPLRALLVGMAGSLVDVYGGELKFDNWNVSLLASRGQARKVQIAYGKNLSGFTEKDELGKYDAVVPFALFNDATYMLTDTNVCSTAPVVYANGTGSIFGYPRILTIDMSNNYTDNPPTQAQLYSDALGYISRNTTSSTANFSTEYVDLTKLIGQTERVDLCDTVYISVRPFNVENFVQKVISITYDALTDENANVEIGDRRITLADTLAGITAADEKSYSAAPQNDQIPYIVGTQASATNLWTGDAPFGTLRVGQAIRYKLPVAGTSTAATLELTLADGSTTGAIGVRRLGSSTVTTTFGAGNVILMTYDGTYWMCDAQTTYSNTIGYQLRTNSSSLPAQAKFYRYRILFTSADGTKWIPANTSTSTNATASRTVNQTPIDPFGEIVYYGTTTAIEANALVTAAQLWQQYTLTLGYSFNRTGAALTLTYPAKVYIKAAPQADGSAIIDDTTPYVQALPSTQDHKIYIELGIAYSATQIEMKMKHPVYYHDGTGIRLFTGGTI